MRKSKQDRLMTNILSYAILQIVNMLVGLFLPRLYLAVYGSEINGVISTVNSFTTYFSYLEAGLGLTLIHALFKPLVDNDTCELNNILSYSKKQYQKISYMYLALVIVLSIVFPSISLTNDMGQLEFASLVLVIGLYGALDFYSMAKYRVLLTADRKEYVISNAMILAQILRFVFVWLLLQFNLSVVLVKAIPILTLIIRSVVLKIYVQRKYPAVNFMLNSNVVISSASHRWDALLLQISISTSVSLPTIIVSQVLGFNEANVYAVYSLVISAIIAIVSALSSGVSPMMGASIARGEDISQTYDIYEYIVSFVLAFVFSITAAMILPFIELYTSVVDDINYIHPTYAILISIWGALYSYRIPITAVINAAGIYRDNRVNNAVNLTIQIALGVGATVLFGVPGLIVVMILAALHRNIGLGVVNSRKLLKNGVGKSLIRQLVISLLVVASWMLSSFVLKEVKYNVITWIGISCLVAIVAFIVCVIIFAAIDIGAARKVSVFLSKKICKKKNTDIINGCKG